METLKQAGGREDCWSEESTATLIEAWGSRYLQSNRGNLRRNDWIEVSDAVNFAGKSFRRSDVQCKNRIDTLKKKYKVEKAKSPPSTWRFFDRLDFLIGNVTREGESKLNSSESTESRGSGDDVEEREREIVVKELANAMEKFGEIYERIENRKQEKVVELERLRLELVKELEFQRMNLIADAQIRLEKFQHCNKKSASSGEIFSNWNLMLVNTVFVLEL